MLCKYEKKNNLDELSFFVCYTQGYFTRIRVYSIMVEETRQGLKLLPDLPCLAHIYDKTKKHRRK